MRIIIAIMQSAMLLTTAAACGDSPTSRPTSVALPDLTGAIRRPLDPGGHKAVVIIFISTECPISNGYAPEINRLCKLYQEKGAIFYLVHTDRTLSDHEAKNHAADYRFVCPVLIDRKHELVRQIGATVTPEAIVVGTDGQVAYLGRIDDLYLSLGKRKQEATTHELRDALDAVIAGNKVDMPRTKAIGCAIAD